MNEVGLDAVSLMLILSPLFHLCKMINEKYNNYTFRKNDEMYSNSLRVFLFNNTNNLLFNLADRKRKINLLCN